MATVGIREMRGALATYVRRAQAGERIVVTVDGVPVAQIAPLSPDVSDSSIDDLVARGRVIAPRRRGGFTPSDPVPVGHGSRVDRAMREVRG